jgi:hypothetical protein
VYLWYKADRGSPSFPHQTAIHLAHPVSVVPASFHMTSQRSEESAKGDKEQVEVANAANLQPLNLQLDTGDEYTNFRQTWWQLW